ncbi:MAG: phosphate ABC transporter permease PstA [Acholeplasmataceae bacterium]
MKNKRKWMERLSKGVVYSLGSVGVFILGMIIYYVTSTGIGLVSWDMLTGDHATTSADVRVETGPQNFEADVSDDIYYSPKWGIGLIDTRNREGNPIVEVAYIHPDSPFNLALDNNNTDENGEPRVIEVRVGSSVEKVFFDNGFTIARNKAESMIASFENANAVTALTVQLVGGGIRGSLITTFWMIGLTLAIAIPIGVSTAVYLNEFAKNTKPTRVLRNMVDLLTGVPSIIYGMLGAAIFIPLLNNLNVTAGGSVYSGALTLAVILLPTIIKSTEEALKVLSDDLRQGSLALGANQTQTVFKVILPNATPGILTGVLLGIGRIIGESAALIFAVGAAIKDNVILSERSSTLAVHIWVVMGGEKPNFELATAIAIIILIVVFIINFLVKMLTKKLNKMIY